MLPANRARNIEASTDERHIRIKLPLNWRTRGYFGTTFGGSIHAATDRIYMVMLNHARGSGYRAWEETARIEFRHPGRSTLYASFDLWQAELDAMRAPLQHGAPPIT